MITNSLEWESKRGELMAQLTSLPYNPELRKMMKNIDGMVGDLSRAEVEARRTKSERYLSPHLDKINESITLLEKVILMGMLLN